MKLYFDDPQFDGQFLRALAYAYYGCADLGECWATAAHIKNGDRNSWYDAWFALAERTSARGIASRDAGHGLSARNAFLRAANYYRTAFVHFFTAPPEPRALTALAKQTDAFQNAAQLFTPRMEPVTIPYQGTTLPGYWVTPEQARRPRPTVILTGGYDGTLEESIMATGLAARARGYNVLAFDGPGQGRALFEQKLYMRPDWENVIRPVVDYALTRSETDPTRIALVGRSFGGYLAPRAASGEPRLAACVADAVLYDLGKGAHQMLGDRAWSAVLAADDAALEPVFAKMMQDPYGRYSIERGMLVHGLSSPRAYFQALVEYSLDGRIQTIACPTLIAEAENDRRRGGGAQAYAQLNVPKKYVLFADADGAGEHCEAGAESLFSQVTFDWLDEIFNHSS